MITWLNDRAGMAQVTDGDILADIQFKITAARVVTTNPPSMAGAQIIPPSTNRSR
jgi:hypothetical protein